MLSSSHFPRYLYHSLMTVIVGNKNAANGRFPVDYLVDGVAVYLSCN